MSDNPKINQKKINPDWFVQGILSKIGDTFDRLTGRGWKPSSNLATSELIERLKLFLDQEAVEEEGQRLFVPHNIKLKMQWDKFSTDSLEAIKKLEHEMLTAAVDHINDKRYYTYAPLKIEAKADYFVSGIKLLVSFDSFKEDNQEAEINVPTGQTIPDNLTGIEPENESNLIFVVFNFDLNGKAISKKIELKSNSRISVGRTKENDLPLDDVSVSKFHASITLNSDSKLVLADTGSTNGTYINGVRIAYGKAIDISSSDTLRFGDVEVKVQQNIANAVNKKLKPTEKVNGYQIGEFEFKSVKTTPERISPINIKKETN